MNYPNKDDPNIDYDELVNMVLLQGDAIEILIKEVEELKSKVKYLESKRENEWTEKESW